MLSGVSLLSPLIGLCRFCGWEGKEEVKIERSWMVVIFLLIMAEETEMTLNIFQTLSSLMDINSQRVFGSILKDICRNLLCEILELCVTEASRRH